MHSLCLLLHERKTPLRRGKRSPTLPSARAGRSPTRPALKPTLVNLCSPVGRRPLQAPALQPARDRGQGQERAALRLLRRGASYSCVAGPRARLSFRVVQVLPRAELAGEGPLCAAVWLSHAGHVPRRQGPAPAPAPRRVERRRGNGAADAPAGCEARGHGRRQLHPLAHCVALEPHGDGQGLPPSHMLARKQNQAEPGVRRGSSCSRSTRPT